MAKLPAELNEKVWSLERELLELLDELTEARFQIEERFRGTEPLEPLEELQNVIEWVENRFKRISTLHLRIATSQPHSPFDMVNLILEAADSAELKIPAVRQSLLEVKRGLEL